MMPGTPVQVVRDDGSKMLTRTRSVPWQLGHGDWVVSVEGISGGYLLSRVHPVETAAATSPEGAR